jgi:hypothetical protein
VEYDITTPIILAAGGSFNMFGLILSVDATLMDYTETSFENASGLAADYIAQQNKSISNNLRTVVNPNFGIEYTIPKSNVRLRGGYFIQKSPYKDDPTSFDKKYYTGGVGLLLGANLTIELAYLHGSWSTFGDNYDYNVSRTYQDLTVDHFGLSFHYRL